MFELRRFLRLAAVHRAEHGRAILWFLGIGIAVHFCAWLLLTRRPPRWLRRRASLPAAEDGVDPGASRTQRP